MQIELRTDDWPGELLPPLSAAMLAELEQVGAGESELLALERVRDLHERSQLAELFCWIAPQNWRRLRAAVRWMRWQAARIPRFSGGADVVVNGLRADFDGFGERGSNDLRCLFLRALWLVSPSDLRRMIVMKSGTGADFLLTLEWVPPASIAWAALPPLNDADRVGRTMPA